MSYPTNPTTGDTHILSGKTWKYDGTNWAKLGFSETISADVANSPGTLIYHSANTAPTGYIKANGAAVSRTTYADLFTAIGTTYGAGDGSTTFNVPDLRGEFMRGWDDSRGIDVSRSFGSSQSHAQRYTLNSFTTAMGTGYSGPPGTSSLTVNGTTGMRETGANDPGNGTTIKFNVTDSSESRPRNIAFLACIKY